METKLLFFLLSGILFQSNIGIYMMEQTEKCQVTLKIAIQMHSHSISIFPNNFWRSSFKYVNST